MSQISVDPQPRGTIAVYLVETRNDEEREVLTSLFDDLTSHVSIRQLSRGRLVTYAVQTRDQDCAILDELERALKSTFTFVVMQRSFDPVIHRIVKELCTDTGSRVLSMPRCNICGKIEPFPDTVITLADESGEVMMSRSYCETCTASLVAKTNKDFVLSLLSADTRDFGQLARSELVRSRGRNHPLRYKVRSAVD